MAADTPAHLGKGARELGQQRGLAHRGEAHKPHARVAHLVHVKPCEHAEHTSAALEVPPHRGLPPTTHASSHTRTFAALAAATAAGRRVEQLAPQLGQLGLSN